MRPNLDHTPHVAVTTGCSHWDRGLDIVVEGTARRVTDAATLDRLAHAWAMKWDGRWQYRPDGAIGFRHANGEHGPIHVYEVQRTKVLAFGKQPYTHTRHRFA